MSNVNDITSIASIIATIVVIGILVIGFCYAVSKGLSSKATITDCNKKIEVQAHQNSNLDE